MCCMLVASALCVFPNKKLNNLVGDGVCVLENETELHYDKVIVINPLTPTVTIRVQL